MYPSEEVPMGAVKGRRQAPWRGQPVKNLQGQVPPEIHAQAIRAADELEVSVAVYLARLVEADLEHRFVRPEDPFVQEALIARSA